MSYLEVREILSGFPAARLVAVSKLQGPEKIEELYRNGQKIFGENYIQEARQKMELLKDLDIEWHFVGHLQSNKVKDVVGQFAIIHSLDRISLARAVSVRSRVLGLRQRVLLEVNIGDEASKSGFSTNFLLEEAAKSPRSNSDLAELFQLEGLIVEGLMCMPPQGEGLSMTRKRFAQTRLLLLELQKVYGSEIHPLNQLSMGTSGDFKIALEEGATWIRLGTSLFGPRPGKLSD